ncbi:tRNA (guanosine(37)-N1)-methyltransferase TrmD [Gammaproteobacteria bacterium]|mgnify:FL=1|nr:tRNA (guanosine(37)-N1)-methyltransferase TrmD [Gammaproteobacteria bacterium]|tara:strand:- start:5890 stop:6633 length:744 start_codon:yes stop_codon:yes gene_type:complete
MHFKIVTIFPKELSISLSYGVVGNAINDNKIRIDYFDPRDHADNKHGSIDDKPYGGGPGMVMQANPVLESIDQARDNSLDIPVFFLSPRGKTFDQNKAKELSKMDKIILVSSRYEGLDQRAIDQTDNHEEISIGDYILSGGEAACTVVIDSIARLIPGVLGDDESILEESFSDGLLEYPHYTRPSEVNGESVPDILLSGDHKKIEQWRKIQSLKNTQMRRPDLIDRSKLTEDQVKVIDDLKNDPENL